MTCGKDDMKVLMQIRCNMVFDKEDENCVSFVEYYNDLLNMGELVTDGKKVIFRDWESVNRFYLQITGQTKKPYYVAFEN